MVVVPAAILRYHAAMIRLDEAEARYEALRERDRIIASLQSKQRMIPMFEQLLDDDARRRVDERLRLALDHVRDDARRLALELARAAFVDLEIDDLVRINDRVRRFEAYLDDHPHERLDCCHDLLTFLRDMRELTGSPRRTAPLPLL
jgi:hypothetical protein